MAGLRGYFNSGEVVLVASTAKTVLQLKAPSNQRLVIHSLRLLGKQAAGGTDTPCKVRLTRSTANFGTGSSVTIAKAVPSDSETIQATANSNFTVEPTTPTDGGLWWEVQPQSGIEEFLPPGHVIVVPGGASANFEWTSTGTPTVMMSVAYEE